ncbi:Protein transport protein bos1 [Marasmius crinis-equi]|uniref:Protein transport protein bos1 n=1 Tax=Marasmius crinis-equi TaxID=585013 RepID=A0ABR3FQC9_9AGAR
MNSLYTSGVRQTSSIQADLERLRNGDASAALLGQISASLAAMNRTIDDYDSMAKREMIKAKQEKAQMRVQKFRSDYNEFRSQFERLKTEATAEREAAQRAELFTGTSLNASSPSDARRRFQNTHPTNNTLHPGLRPQNSSTSEHSESPFRGPTPQLREDHALREHTFIQNTHAQLDDFLAQGRDVLDNLVDQRNILKGTQSRLMSAANTLGLSRDVIGWIERRSLFFPSVMDGSMDGSASSSGGPWPRSRNPPARSHPTPAQTAPGMSNLEVMILATAPHEHLVAAGNPAYLHLWNQYLALDDFFQRSLESAQALRLQLQQSPSFPPGGPTHPSFAPLEDISSPVMNATSLPASSQPSSDTCIPAPASSSRPASRLLSPFQPPVSSPVIPSEPPAKSESEAKPAPKKPSKKPNPKSSTSPKKATAKTKAKAKAKTSFKPLKPLTKRSSTSTSISAPSSKPPPPAPIDVDAETDDPSPSEPVAKLNQKSYPSIQFWHEHNFHTARRLPNTLTKSTDFLESEHGVPLSLAERMEIYSEAHAYWESLAVECGGVEGVPCFRETSAKQRNEIAERLERRFPVMAMCAESWKAKRVWIHQFKTWRQGAISRKKKAGAKNESGEGDVDADADAEGDEVVEDTAKMMDTSTSDGDPKCMSLKSTHIPIPLFL